MYISHETALISKTNFHLFEVRISLGRHWNVVRRDLTEHCKISFQFRSTKERPFGSKSTSCKLNCQGNCSHDIMLSVRSVHGTINTVQCYI